jgi:hypothetical protein
MASTIVPADITPDSAHLYLDTRTNFERAKADIEALQAASVDSGNFSGDVSYGGNISYRAGELFWNGNVIPTTFADTTTFVKILGGSALTVQSEFDDGGSSNRLRYTGATTRLFNIVASFSFTISNNNQTVEFIIMKNGVTELTSSLMRDKISTGGDADALSTRVVASLSQNDYVGLWARNITTTASITVQTLNFSCMAIN